MIPLEKPRREIRSFVRREGRTTPSQQHALEKFSKDYVLCPKHPLVFSNIFSNAHPVILEIGFGMGHSLVAQALANPNINFIGIEVHRPGIGALLASIVQHQLTNIRIIAEDATISLEAFLEESLTGVQIFFPDPWPKKRHHKRRLVNTAFVTHLATKLKKNGYLHCATDWEPYAQWMVEAIEQTTLFCNESSKDVGTRTLDRPTTKFEKRGIRLGHEIYDLLFRKQ